MTRAQAILASLTLAVVPGGHWIVNRWAIRMPVFQRIGKFRQYELLGYREVGGTADPMTPPDP